MSRDETPEEAAARARCMDAFVRAVLRQKVAANDDGQFETISMGPLTIDVPMALAHGWGRAGIERAVSALAEVARREHDKAHETGPVAGCPCEACDARTKFAELLQESSRRLRERWALAKGVPTP